MPDTLATCAANRARPFATSSGEIRAAPEKKHARVPDAGATPACRVPGVRVPPGMADRKTPLVLVDAASGDVLVTFAVAQEGWPVARAGA